MATDWRAGHDTEADFRAVLDRISRDIPDRLTVRASASGVRLKFARPKYGFRNLWWRWQHQTRAIDADRCGRYKVFDARFGLLATGSLDAHTLVVGREAAVGCLIWADDLFVSRLSAADLTLMRSTMLELGYRVRVASPGERLDRRLRMPWFGRLFMV